MKVTIYEKSTCTTCRQVYAALQESGVDVASVNYCADPLSAAQIRRLLRKIGCTARDILRAKDPIYKELGLAGKELSDDEIIDLMARHPDLLQRPIVERGDWAILARPAERIRAFLS